VRVVERYEVEVAVVGAGPAGMAAAVEAAEAGRRVALLDEGLGPGGQIWRHRERWDVPTVAGWWMARLDRCGARVAHRVTVADAVAVAGGFELLAERDGAPLAVRAERVVLATGARELFLPFPGWTLPDVVGVGGLQALLKSGLEVRGRRVVVAGSGPLLLPVAALAAKAGARLLLVAEQTPGAAVRRFARGLWRHPGKLLQAARYRWASKRSAYRRGVWVTAAAGDDRVRGVTLTDGEESWSGKCDLLAVGYGLVPETTLARLLGCATERGRVVVDERQETTVPGLFCAGEPTGVGGADLALVEGRLAGLAAAGVEEGVTGLRRTRRRLCRFADRLERAFALRDELRDLARPDTVVCRCEDVTRERLARYGAFREAKLATRCGMGPCQARVCGPALEWLEGWAADTVRPPVKPVRVATFLARLD
jgi:thioredoxin reductase